MTALVPDPTTLGLESPALGPWFSDSTITLPAPADDLGVSVLVTANTSWLPPATGTLSFEIAGPVGPLHQQLSGPAGASPFTGGRLLAIFRVLPEVEARLGALLTTLPTVDGSTQAVPTRSRPRTVVLELPEASPGIADLTGRVRPPIDASITTPADQAAHLGLALSGGQLVGTSDPITDLKRPGTFAGSSEELLTFPVATTVRMFAFDHRGRALDPGAVAAWLAALATTSFTNLWAPGLSGADQRTVNTDAHLGVALVGPHEGAADAAVLAALVAPVLTGSGPVRACPAAGNATLALTGGAPNTAPTPRVAVLPTGPYASTVTLWPTGPVGGLTRDFVRVGLVDIERHLTGQPRVADAGANPTLTRRAADQARARTQILVAQATTTATETVLLGTTEAVLGALGPVLAAGGSLVTPVIDRACGPLTVALPAVPPDPTVPTVTMTALTGGGSATGDTAIAQRVLVTVTCAASMAGAWVRVWTQTFDEKAGVHKRGTGGAGLVGADGRARVVVRLPDGSVAPDNLMGLDVMLVTAVASVRFPETRVARPAPLGGAAVPWPTTGTVLVCEAGTEGPAPLTAVPSGATLVLLSSPPAILDPTTVPTAALAAGCLGPSFTAAGRLLLSEPPWRGWRAGESAAALGAGGAASIPAASTSVTRTGLTRLLQVGAPLPTQGRDEVAAAALGVATALGVVAGVTLGAAHHEVGTHQGGHAGAPADEERHGAGALVRGPAVVALAEVLRDRTAGTTPELAVAAATPLASPPVPTIPGTWAATLRTVGFGVEAEAALVPVLDLVGANALPLDGAYDDARNWLSGKGIALPAAAGAAAESVLRALDRRLLGARYGFRESAQALAEAFGRAEDLVYLETPALDTLAIGTGEDRLDVLGGLTARLTARPGLRILVCVPIELAPGAPAKLQRVRDKGVRAALAALASAAGERLAVFCPVTGPGRDLRMDATTVVIDDVFALTGSTHLWRRGLCFDASLAVSVFDERLIDGRPAEILGFRRAAVAGRLGLPVGLLPDDPDGLIDAVRALTRAGGGTRLSTHPILVPDPDPSDLDVAVWNPDGSPVPGWEPMSWLAGLAAGVQAELLAEIDT